jgi:hypothetical protein
LQSMFGMQDEALENMFIVFSEAHKNIPWFHTCCSQMLTVEVLSSTSIKFQGLMSDLAGYTPACQTWLAALPVSVLERVLRIKSQACPHPQDRRS